MKKITFVVTSDHLKLLKEMCVGWDDCEFGAPCIDPKRPYGNSDVISDMKEILGKKPKGGLNSLHREMEIVLQILVSNLSISPGKYETEQYEIAWRRKK